MTTSPLFQRPLIVPPSSLRALRPCSGRGEPVEPRLRRGRQHRPFIVSSDPSSSVPTFRGALAQRVHDRIERLARRPRLLGRQRRERLVDYVEERQEIGAIGLDIDQAGGKLATGGRLVDCLLYTSP